MSFQSLLSLHLLGVVIGLGGAVVSDIMFLLSVRDGRITLRELMFLKRGGRTVWAGLAVLFTTGVGLVLHNPEAFLSSPVFLAKMTSVAVLVVNGLVFHLVHIPWLQGHTDQPLSLAPDFKARRSGILLSGALSVSSWATAFLLAASHGLTLQYIELVALYILGLAITVSVSLVMRDKIVPARA